MQKNTILFLLMLSFTLHSSAQNLVTSIPDKNSKLKTDTIFTVLDAKTNYKYYVASLADGTSETGYLLNGKKNGTVKRYFANGVLLSLTEYKDNLKNGTYIECEKTGSIAKEENYKDGQLNGQVKIFSISKNVRYVKSNYNYKNGVYDGVQTEYNELGKPSSETSYKNGKKNGISKWYFNNGQLAMEQAYADDKIEGTYKSYNQDGRLSGQGQYVNGLKIGSWTEYNPNGTLKSEGMYKDDVKQGTWKYYDENGNLLRSETL